MKENVINDLLQLQKKYDNLTVSDVKSTLNNMFSLNELREIIKVIEMAIDDKVDEVFKKEN